LSESAAEQDRNEEKVKKEQVPKIILLGYIVMKYHDKSICVKEYVRIQEENKNKKVRVQRDDEDEDYIGKVFL
jgi:hypothetical protein